MKNKSLTEIRNAKIVGKNSRSYNDKHPENPVSLRPIHDACKAAPAKYHARLRALSNLGRPALTRGIVAILGSSLKRAR